MTTDNTNKEDFTDFCQWENCSGGKYCEKHSLERKPEDWEVELGQIQNSKMDKEEKKVAVWLLFRKALSTQEEKIIEHIIKCIETDPEIKIPRSYDASWILTNLQFYKKGEHQSPWFNKDITYK